MVAPITHGADHNFFRLVTVTETTFPTESHAFFNVKYLAHMSLVNYGSVKVEYSFDGINVHGDLRPSTPTAALFFDNRRATAIWFRVPSSSAEVRIEAWSST